MVVSRGTAKYHDKTLTDKKRRGSTYLVRCFAFNKTSIAILKFPFPLVLLDKLGLTTTLFQPVFLPQSIARLCNEAVGRSAH